jgi:hypothetical protein
MPATSEYFNRCKYVEDGLHNYCRECQRIYRKQYREKNLERERENFRVFYQQNVQQQRQRVRDYYQAHAEEKRAYRKKYYSQNIQHNKEYHKKRYAANRDKQIELAREWRRANPDKKREQGRRWQRQNRDKVKASYNRRRARKLDLPYDFSATDWKYALEYWGNRCAICGRSEQDGCKLVADHWIPLNYDRDHNPGTVPWNILPLCHGPNSCNNRKHDKHPELWLLEMFDETEARQKLSEIEIFFQSLIKNRERNWTCAPPFFKKI